MKTLLFLLSFNLFYSQIQKHFIYDELNRHVIPFAEVEFFRNDSTKTILYSSKNGLIQIENISTINKIKISIPGYDLKTIKPNELRDTIFVEKKSEELKEVVIKSKIKESYEIGYHNESKKLRISSSKGLEILVFIENNANKETMIKSFMCKIIKNKSFTSAVRLHFYNKDPEKLYPNEEITNDNIITYLKGNINKNLEIDLTKYGLYLPIEGIFIGLEWLGEYDELNDTFLDNQYYETKIDLNDAFEQSISFTRNHLNNSTWGHLCDDLKKYANINTTNCLNASFGIKVYKE